MLPSPKHMIHHKKCVPDLFEAVRAGQKPFEVRLADFEVQSGDRMVLEEWDPIIQSYTGRTCTIEIGYILKTKDVSFWKQKDIETYGFQVMDIKRVE